MTKARIDWMSAGKVRINSPACSFISRTEDVVISASSTYDGQIRPGSTAGQHVVEYQILSPEAVFTITYWDASSTGIYVFAWYDANHNLIGGRKGSGRGARTANFYFPNNTVYLRVYGIYRSGSSTYTANASVTPRDSEDVVYSVEEIRVKAEGDSVSQIVWPLFENWIISSAALDVTDSIRYDGEWVMRPSSTSYCYATGTVQHRRGTTVIEEFSNVPLTAVSIDHNSSAIIDGETKQVFTITTKNGRSVVTGVDMRTTPDSGGFSAGVTFTYQGLASTVLTVKQAPNTASANGYVDQQDLSYRIELSPLTLGQSGGYVTVYGYLTKTRTQRYQWTSWAYSYGAPEVYDEAHLTSVSVTPTPTSINGAVVTLPGNSGTSEIVYTFTGYYSGYQAENHATVYGSDSGHTYSNLSVSASYPDDISAGGGGVYPTVSISIKQDNSYTLTGTARNGATSCTVSDRTRSTIVAISYSNGANGFISANSRGSVPGPRQEVASCRVDVSKAMRNGTISASSTASAWQAANVETITAGNFNLTGLAVVPLVSGQALPIESGAYKLDTAAETTVYVQVLASGSGTTTKYEYTSGIPPVGGESVNLDNDPVTPRNVSVSVGQTPVTVTNQEFSASNAHTTTPKTYSLSATYESGSASSSMVQVADEKIDSDERNYTVTLEEVSGTNTLSAAGGEVKVKAAAYYTTGKVWKSDGTSAEEYSVPTYDLEILTIVATQNIGYTRSTDSTTSTYIVFKFQHRDMKNNETTDPLVIYAKAGNYKDTSNSPLSYSVTNYEITTQTYREEGETTRGEPYPVDKDYGVLLTVNNYTSQETAASFRNATPTTYYVNAYHVRDFYQEVTTLMYEYHRYTSWTALHDDLEHKILVGTSTITAHEKISTSDVTGDSYSVSTADTWLTINQTNQTISIADQIDSEQGTRRRGGQVVAVNSLDLSANPASDTRVVWQEAYKKLVVSPTQHTFDWKKNPTIIINIRSFYTQFKIRQENTLCTLSISQTGAEGSWVAVDTDTNYGQTASVQQYYLRVTRKNINYDTYTKLSDITLLPTSANVPQQIIRIVINAYDGGPTD